MLYNIIINQKALIELSPEIKLQEAVLLNYLINICGSKSPKIAEKRLDGFTWIDYNKIIQDLPLLEINTPAGLVTKIKNLEDYGYIKTFKETLNTGIRKYFDITDKCDLLTFDMKPLPFTTVNSQTSLEDKPFTNVNSENDGKISTNSATCHSKYRHLPQQMNNGISNDGISSNKYLNLSLILRKYITDNNPKEIVKESQIHNWANEFRLMVERDGRTEEEIKAVLEWCQNDAFWKMNILSAGKFREKFGRLHAGMSRKPPAKKESLLERERKDDYVVKKQPIVK